MSDSSNLDHGRLIQQALDQGAGARSALAASWKRSMSLYGLDPMEGGQVGILTERELAEAQSEAEALMRASTPLLDRLYQAVGGLGCCVLLCNADGVPIDRRGAAADDAQFRRWGLWTGAVWSEACEGTNSIGTALAEKLPVTVHRDQHFLARNTALSCVAYPLFDHRGELVGALDVSSSRADSTANLIALITTAVADAARVIEARLFRQGFAGARILLAGEVSDRNPSALLAVDRYDLVIGASRAARRLLPISDSQIASHLPASTFLTPAREPTDLEEAERGAVVRALAQAGGNVSAAARALNISRATLHRKLNRLGLKAAV